LSIAVLEVAGLHRLTVPFTTLYLNDTAPDSDPLFTINHLFIIIIIIYSSFAPHGA
jgi:hypothetical protein